MLLFDDQVEDFSKLEFGEQRLLHFLSPRYISQMGRDGRIRKLFFTKTVTCDTDFFRDGREHSKEVSNFCFHFSFCFLI